MLLLNLISPLLIVTFTIITTASSENYCSKKLCGRKKHIACKNDGKFGEKCPTTVEVVPLTDELETFIVDKHNKIRKGVAEGNYKGLESPNRMIEMKWNRELAQLAEYTAKTCEYKHDDCRNTETFENVGQNIAMYSTTAAAPIKYKDLIGTIIDSWLTQAKDLTMELVEQFRSDAASKKVDDFAQIIRASCSQVGCAVVYFLEKGTEKTEKDKKKSVKDTKNVFFVCNYSSANVPKEPIYEVGLPCSACQAGCSNTSPGLCITDEDRYLVKLHVLNLLKLKL